MLLAPVAPWEFIKRGNCGSPIGTEAGGLVLSGGGERFVIAHRFAFGT